MKRGFPFDYMMKDGIGFGHGTQYHAPMVFGFLIAQTNELARAAGYSVRRAPIVIKPLKELGGVEVRAKFKHAGLSA